MFIMNLIAGGILSIQAGNSATINETYTVQPGDNLYRIALTHDVPLEDLARDNAIEQLELIHPGDTLIIKENKTRVTRGVADSSSESNLVYGEELEKWQYNTLLAVVQQEAGFDYDSALAVMSVITNRVDAKGFDDTVWGVVTARSQFEAYGAGHYKRHLGNITEDTRRAVKEALSGKKTVTYLNFWSDWYAEQKGVSGPNIGGNVYFNY